MILFVLYNNYGEKCEILKNIYFSISKCCVYYFLQKKILVYYISLVMIGFFLSVYMFILKYWLDFINYLIYKLIFNILINKNINFFIKQI